MCCSVFPLEKGFIIIGRLRFHYDNENEILCADIIISCVLPGFLFVIVVVDEMEATSRSFICLQKHIENDSDIELSFSNSSFD